MAKFGNQAHDVLHLTLLTADSNACMLGHVAGPPQASDSVVLLSSATAHNTMFYTSKTGKLWRCLGYLSSQTQNKPKGQLRGHCC
jgi:hypothetical protein